MPDDALVGGDPARIVGWMRLAAQIVCRPRLTEWRLRLGFSHRVQSRPRASRHVQRHAPARAERHFKQKNLPTEMFTCYQGLLSGTTADG